MPDPSDVGRADARTPPTPTSVEAVVWAFNATAGSRAALEVGMTGGNVGDARLDPRLRATAVDLDCQLTEFEANLSRVAGSPSPAGVDDSDVVRGSDAGTTSNRAKSMIFATCRSAGLQLALLASLDPLGALGLGRDRPERPFESSAPPPRDPTEPLEIQPFGPNETILDLVVVSDEALASLLCQTSTHPSGADDKHNRRRPHSAGKGKLFGRHAKQELCKRMDALKRKCNLESKEPLPRRLRLFQRHRKRCGGDRAPSHDAQGPRRRRRRRRSTGFRRGGVGRSGRHGVVHVGVDVGAGVVAGHADGSSSRTKPQRRQTPSRSRDLGKGTGLSSRQALIVTEEGSRPGLAKPASEMDLRTVV